MFFDEKSLSGADKLVTESTVGPKIDDEIKLLLAEATFNGYQDSGVFENVVYTWTFENGFYTVIVDLESNKQFYSNMKGILSITDI